MDLIKEKVAMRIWAVIGCLWAGWVIAVIYLMFLPGCNQNGTEHHHKGEVTVDGEATVRIEIAERICDSATFPAASERAGCRLKVLEVLARGCDEDEIN